MPSLTDGHVPDGIYYVVNQATGRYATILNDDDRTEVVDIDVGLGKKEDVGHKVRLDVGSHQPSNKIHPSGRSNISHKIDTAFGMPIFAF